MRSLVRRVVREEDGIALVMALALILVLSITTAGILLAGTVNQRETYVSNQERQAFAIAQEGLAFAEGMVYAAAQNHGTPPTGTQDLPAQPVGSGTYYASVAADGVTWTMVGTGTVAGITRTVSAQANVPSAVTTTDPSVWNYLYADSTSLSCPLSISGGVSVSVPILTRGNLCISGGGHYTGSQLEVGGNFSDTGGSNVGTASSSVAKVKVAGSCTVQPNSTYTVTPGTSYCNGRQSPLWATAVGTTLDVTPSMPSIGQPSSWNPNGDGSWAGLKSVYANEAALAKSGCPANLFDNDSTMNDSLSSSALTSAMFPSNSSYDCKVGSSEIKWTATGQFCGSGTLYVSGTLVFDGSLSLGCGWKIVYSGQASLWFVGGVTIAGGVDFCGIANCTASWNPDVNGVIVVAGCWANSTGSSLITSSCVHLSGGAKGQFGVYAVTQYTEDGGTVNMGPVLANNISLAGGAATLIPFHEFPPGTPLNTSTSYLPASPPTDWAG